MIFVITLTFVVNYVVPNLLLRVSINNNREYNVSSTHTFGQSPAGNEVKKGAIKVEQHKANIDTI